YRFLQTLPLANNALAIRIIFPSVGVIQVSFNLTGLPASLGKQIKRAGDQYRPLFQYWIMLCTCLTDTKRPMMKYHRPSLLFYQVYRRLRITSAKLLTHKTPDED
ncbi:hypothetical protein WMQ32_24400, partial [Vibrio diabolicus]